MITRLFCVERDKIFTIDATVNNALHNSNQTNISTFTTVQFLCCFNACKCLHYRAQCQPTFTDRILPLLDRR